ncbi:MAG: carboxypeptidase-like regulatory domain-containing protein [Cyclobacteriaceae bacterium]
MLILSHFYLSGQSKRTFSVDLRGKSADEALNLLSDSSGYYFAYLYDIPKQLNEAGFRSYTNVSLNKVLDLLIANTSIEYFYLKDQVILRELTIINPPKYLVGKILQAGTQKAVPYATIELKGKNLGVVSDFKARYTLNVETAGEGDTLLISSVGYVKQEIPFAAISLTDSLRVMLEEKSYAIAPVEISRSHYIAKVLGEVVKKLQGEMYMDTHGQQAALFFSNEDSLAGKIENLRFYLSPKGNTHAPFRVRLYDVNLATGQPGRDLIPNFLVVQPEIIRGWYEVDVFEYEIDIPAAGFFVAIEGVFPTDPELIMRELDTNLLKSNGVKKKKDLILRVLSYGQRIGFRRSKENRTWHYSLSGEWFQLPRQSYNVMMGARLLIDKDQTE